MTVRPGTQRLCCICGQLAGDPQNDLIHELLGRPAYERRIIAESPAAAAIPSLGPVALGHSLLCPKDHKRSLAATSLAVRDEVSALASVMARRLRAVYNTPIHRFEHGNSRYGVHTLCSVEHAHLHLVPFAGEVWTTARALGSWQELDADPKALSDAVGDEEYLYYESPDGPAFVMVGADPPLESQVMRRVFAERAGARRSWNWRNEPDPIAADRAYRTLASA